MPVFLRRFSEPRTFRQNREMVFHETRTFSFWSNSLMVSKEAPLWRKLAISSLYCISSLNNFDVRS
jgi:hypothetical protein